MQYYPAPNVGVGTAGYDRFNNWIGSGTSLTNNDQWTSRSIIASMTATC